MPPPFLARNRRNLIGLAVMVVLVVVWLIASRSGDRPTASGPTTQAAATTTAPLTTSTSNSPASTSRPTTTPPTTDRRTTGTTTRSPTSRPAGTDPASGLRWINESALPAQARQTIALIRAGGPYPYPRNDDVTYHNNNRALPRQPDGFYREYTVITPGSATRGARRIIAGQDGSLYYTADHYTTFARIREGS